MKKVITTFLLATSSLLMMNCNSKQKPQNSVTNQDSSSSSLTTTSSNDLEIKDYVEFNHEYLMDPVAFKQKYLKHKVTFTGFFYRPNAFRNDFSFLLRYPSQDKIGTDPIQVVELRFSTPKPNDILYSYVIRRSPNKYWIYDTKSNKLLDEMDEHTKDDINEEPPAFYIPKIEEYIDEDNQQTKGYLLHYYDNALSKFFKKYDALVYKQISPDDFDYNHIQILEEVKIIGTVNEINVQGNGMVWIKLSGEKILSSKKSFTLDGTKSLTFMLMKDGSSDNKVDSTSEQ